MSQIVEVKVPDIGDFKDVPIIDLLVKVGDQVKAEDSLITVESDKATMDVPSPVAGVITDLKLKVGDRVSEGTLVAMIDCADAASPVVAETPAAAVAALTVPVQPLPSVPVVVAPPPGTQSAADFRPGDTELVLAQPRVSMPTPADRLQGQAAHASPSVRRFARELGVDVGKVTGSGPKGRITQGDVQAYVKGVISGSTAAGVAPPATSGGGLDLLPWPKIDFAKFGAIETKPLSRIKKISGANLHRNWVTIPHITQFDEADITEMEAFRKELNTEYAKQKIKITPLAFMLKAVVVALQEFPEFNASLDNSGENLVLKKYFHVGVAVDTPNGLMVPVLRDVDKKGIVQLAKELGEISAKARDLKITAAEMQGGCFSISSLGGIGGTAFTPIINAPELAILGVSKAIIKPIHQDETFVARLMLPLSLSYDHRVIDGAAAARFIVFLSQVLSDTRRLAL